MRYRGTEGDVRWEERSNENEKPTVRPPASQPQGELLHGLRLMNNRISGIFEETKKKIDSDAA